MVDKTLPPPKRPPDADGGAQEPGREAALAQTIEFEPFDSAARAADTRKGDLPPAAGLPVGAATEETQPRGGDPTCMSPSPLGPGLVPASGQPRAEDATFVAPPSNTSPDITSQTGDQTLSPHFMQTVEMRAANSVATDQTIEAGPDATMGGGLDAGTRAFHQAAMASAPKAITKGASFGHYELIEPIAKGGMGIVYKARQRNLNRVVAIKMILAGQFADQSDIDRFYAEAEAAAALSHPNIVAIHEIGEVSGQHFFSMDYIEGQSLSGLVQENPIPPRRAAEFVRTIAETMQFAHESGVVHRDLKPANVLLDKRQRPLITDFGLAKQVSNASQLTMAGSIVGTPSYMPPEQAAGKIEDVGPWSDLYSIGAILYELLTGRPPFRAASPFETIRQVLEQEPPSPRLLNPALPRDLETICLKCLQKERARRYDSAQELADELGRFLRGEPIHARPISQAARFWRLCKRYPLTASAIALAVVVLIAATCVSTAFYIQATRSLVQEQAAKAKAVRRNRQTMQAINDLFTIVSESTLLNQPGTQPVRRQLLEKARSYYQELSVEDPNDPEFATELAGANFRMGRIAVMLGSLDDAIRPLETAREMQRKLVNSSTKDAEKLRGLSETLMQLGQIWIKKKDYEAARRCFAEAVDIRKELAEAFPGESEYQRLWANAHMNLGLVPFYRAQLIPENEPDFSKYLNEASQEYEKAQKIRETWIAHDAHNALIRRDLAKNYYNLGDLAWLDKRDPDAIDYFKKAASEFETLLNDEPGDLENQGLLATCYRLLGDLYNFNTKPKQGRDAYQKALERLDKLAKENPEVADYQSQQGSVFLNLYKLEINESDSSAAREALEHAQNIYGPLVEKYPTVPAFQHDLAVTLRELARVEVEAGDSVAAAEHLAEATRKLEALVEEHPDEIAYKNQLEETKNVKLVRAPD